MKRTLSITMDDDTQMITIEGGHLFSILESFGIAEHINVHARLKDIQAIEAAQAKPQAAKPKRKPATKKRRTK